MLKRRIGCSPEKGEEASLTTARRLIPEGLVLNLGQKITRLSPPDREKMTISGKIPSGRGFIPAVEGIERGPLNPWRRTQARVQKCHFVDLTVSGISHPRMTEINSFAKGFTFP